MALFLLGTDKKALTLLAFNTFKKNSFKIFLLINIVLPQKIESKETLKEFKTFDLLFMSMKSFKKYPKKHCFQKKVQNLSKTGHKTLCNLSIFFSAEHSCGFEQI